MTILAIALATGGCSGGDSGGGIAAKEFCQQAVTAVCSTLDRCGRLTGTLDECQTQLSTDGDCANADEASVCAGQTYDSEKAADCVVATETVACEDTQTYLQQPPCSEMCTGSSSSASSTSSSSGSTSSSSTSSGSTSSSTSSGSTSSSTSSSGGTTSSTSSSGGGGAANLGVPCSPSTACPGGETCAGIQGIGNQSAGFCTIPCAGPSDSATCADGYAGGVGTPGCSLQTSVGYQCGILCTSPGDSATCPEGLSCFAAGGGAICAAE